MAGLLLLTLSGFVSLDEKLMPGDIDSAWNLTLFWAHTPPIDFGHDLVFTFGPWGFIYHGYAPEAARWHLAGWSLIGAAFFAGIYQIGRRISANRWIGAAWMLAVIIVAGLTVDLSQDMRLFLPAWVLLWLQFAEPREKMTVTRGMLVAALALASLIKFTVLLMAFPIIAIITAHEIAHRRYPKILPAWMAFIAIFWIAAGQSIVSLGPWLMHGWELSSGYAQAMEYSQGDRGGAEIALFLAGAVLFLAAVVVGLWQRCPRDTPRWRKCLNLLPPMIALAASVFVLFKDGFIRQDIHEMVAVNSLVLLCLLAAGMLWKSMSNWVGRPLMVIAVGVNSLIASNSCSYWESESWARQIAGEFRAVGAWPAGAWRLGGRGMKLWPSGTNWKCKTCRRSICPQSMAASMSTLGQQSDPLPRVVL